ncbi:MAG: type 1 glutamine amidotransferase [Nocardioidaceae bacterium]
MTPPHLLVVQHEDDCTPSWFGQWFLEAGVTYDVVLGHRGAPVPGELGSYDGLVVLGGEMGAYDDDANPWLTPTKRLIAHTVADHGCFLGICLGHQLAAVALGGQVEVNPLGRAAGLTSVRLTPEGEQDPLLGIVASGARAVQWNDDVVTRLPAGAVQLATSPDGSIQAARFGPRAWGVQFHPETSPAVFASWVKVVDPEAAGFDSELHAASEGISAAGDELQQSWRPFASRFAALVSEQRALSMS